MPWWNRKSAASPSSSPSPSSAASSPGGYPAAAGPAHSRVRRFLWTRRIRHHPDIEVSASSFDSGSTPVSRSPSYLDCHPGRSSSSPIVRPHPLPLPELAGAAASPHRESTSATVLGLGLPSPNPVCCPLPSTRDPSSKSEGDGANPSDAESSSVVEQVGERVSSAVTAASRLPFQTSSRNLEPSDRLLNGSTRHNRKILKNSDSAGAVYSRLKIPAKSAPTSGLASPIRSPLCSPQSQRLNKVEFSTLTPATPGHQVWAAPKMPSADVVSGFSPQTSPDKTIGSPDNSPLCSPTTRSPVLRSRYQSAPSSPLHKKMFSENSASWYDNGGNISVHPLPLPPGVASPSQSGSPHHNVAKGEALPITDQWQKGKLIGSGTFGNVYVATNRVTGASCAMKEVNIIQDDAKLLESIKQLEQEVKFLSQFKHPNIVQYYQSEIIDDKFYICLEYVHPGSINNFVRQHSGAMTESVVRNFTRHILNGLVYLHSKNIVHRDIKGANLLVDGHGVVKLADFGMAKHLSGAVGALLLKGSPYWMAPEVMQATMNKEIGYDLAVDIWSLGCTIIEMLTGKHPWSGLEGLIGMFKVLYKDPPIPESLSNEGKDFLRRCFCRNPAERPTADVLLVHPFILNSHHHGIHGSL